mgnify:CR=1 FL=1
MQEKSKGISLYYQVESQIREKIESGKWELGSRLPTEIELANYFGVSRTTIRQAVNGMVEAGMLIRRQGSGTYIAKSPFARNRLDSQPSNAVCKYIYSPQLQDDLKRSYHNMLLTIVSHILMLHHQKLITNENGRSLLEYIMPMFERDPYHTGSNPLYEDCFLNFEQHLIANLGVALSSEYLIARSRNDMTPTMIRLTVRDSLLSVCSKLLRLIRQLLELAEEHQGKIITAHTHMQPSQAITLDHYFLAIAEALIRDLGRLMSGYDTLNLSPLGACAISGTSYPIDREYAAGLLGFDGIIENSLDAIASRDFLLELSAGYSTLGSTIDRFTQDLYIWSTHEFGYVSFSDSTSCCSSIMPQKKNPLSAEHIRSKASHLTSAYLDIIMCLKGTTYSHSRDLFECMPPFWQCTENIIAMLDLSSDMLSGLEFDYDKMKTAADGNSLTLTEISNFLERTGEYPFRSAHSVIARAVNECTRAGASLSLASLNAASNALFGKPVPITSEEFSALMNLENSVSNKKSAGSPSPASCKKMLHFLRSAAGSLGDKLSWLNYTLSVAEQKRNDTVKKIIQ